MGGSSGILGPVMGVVGGVVGGLATPGNPMGIMAGASLGMGVGASAEQAMSYDSAADAYAESAAFQTGVMSEAARADFLTSRNSLLAQERQYEFQGMVAESQVALLEKHQFLNGLVADLNDISIDFNRSQAIGAIERTLNKVSAGQMVAGAKGNIDPTSGSFVTVSRASASAAERDIATATMAANLAEVNNALQSSMSRMQGESQIISTKANAADARFMSEAAKRSIDTAAALLPYTEYGYKMQGYQYQVQSSLAGTQSQMSLLTGLANAGIQGVNLYGMLGTTTTGPTATQTAYGNAWGAGSVYR